MNRPSRLGLHLLCVLALAATTPPSPSRAQSTASVADSALEAAGWREPGLPSISRRWLLLLLLTLPAGVGGIALLFRTVASLKRLSREAVISSVPLRAAQPVEFPTAGEFALNLEGPRFTTRFAGLDFTLTDAAAGSLVALHPVLFRTQVSGGDRGRLEYRSFTLAHPGTYTLRIIGVESARLEEASIEAADRPLAGDATDYSAERVVFARRFTGSLVLHVLALLGLGFVVMGSLVGSILLVVFSQAGRR